MSSTPPPTSNPNKKMNELEYSTKPKWYGSDHEFHMDMAGVKEGKNDVGHLETVPAVPEDIEQGELGGAEAWADIKNQANTAIRAEKELTLWESLRIYKASVFWAAAASLSIIMEGYDTALLANFWGLPAFQQRYGELLPGTNTFQVPAPWQIAIGQAPVIGNIFGIFIGGYFVDRMGYRRTLFLFMFMMLPFIGMTTFAPNRVVLLIGELFCGIPWGVFSTLAEAYSSEVCPLTLRGYLTTYVNLCWVIGQLVCAGVILGIQNVTGEWAYRLPFALQWIWPPPLMIIIYLSPESPWWLVRQGKLEAAERSVRRLASSEMKDHARDTVAMMVRTNQLEMDVDEGTGYLDCFRGSDLRRTEISVVAWGCQQFCGLPFAGWAVYFFQQAGLAVSDSYKMGLGKDAGAFCGTVGSWFLITHFGRRTIFLYGMGVLAAGQLIIGILSIVADRGDNSSAQWAQAVVLLCWVFLYDLTIGPLAYCIVGEASSTRLRNKTVGLSRNFYNIIGIISGILTPYMLNPGDWNWRGKTGFFWFPIAVAFTFWTYYRLPEFKGRSYYELDILFESGVRARDFSRTMVEFDHDQIYTEGEYGDPEMAEAQAAAQQQEGQEEYQYSQHEQDSQTEAR